MEDLVKFGNNFVCVNCKPGYVQRMREGAQPIGGSMAGVRYAGFWIRGLALLIDGLIVGIIGFVIGFAVSPFSMGLGLAEARASSALGMVALMYLIVTILVFAYNVWFVSQRGGTIGKLALQLRVVTTDGRNLTVARAAGRYAALLIEPFTLYIGLIIAGFDSEKRALHDHICSTRVIRK